MRGRRAQKFRKAKRLKQAYGKLLDATSRVVGQPGGSPWRLRKGLKRSTDILQQAVLDGLRKEHRYHAATEMQQVIKQTRTRIFGGETRAEGKILSLFEEPSTK